jgi:pyrroline-5-carboxylate reductase
MTIGFLGAGKMAEAMLAALLRGHVARPCEVAACEVIPERLAAVADRFGIRACPDPASLLAVCRTVVLAVKPQDLDGLLTAVAPSLTRRHLLVSIAAGRTLARLQRLAGPSVRLVRVMPNLPLTVGEGMSVFCLGRQALPADRARVRRLLGGAGRVLEMDESLFDAVTALSGSGPAFFAFVASRLEAAAVAEGMPAAAARLLACQTMLGAARYLLETGQDPQTFMQAVASPKGTTAAGLAVLETSDAGDVLRRTLQAAAARSRELAAQ